MAALFLTPVLAVYGVLGIPAWLYLTLRKAKQEQQLYSDPQLRKSLGWVYLKYEDRHFWYDCWYMVERMLTVAGSVLLLSLIHI